MSETIGSIDAAVVEGINQRINAAVLAALTSDDLFSTIIAAEMNKPVETSRYSSKKEPYVVHLLRRTIGAATQEAVKAVAEEQKPLLVEEVRKAVKRSATPLAEALVAGFTAAAESSYRMDIQVKLETEE